MTTPQQYRLYCFIIDYVHARGYAPSFQEMMQANGQKSKSGIYRLLNGLEERGLIRRLPNRSRAIEILKPPVNELVAQIQKELKR